MRTILIAWLGLLLSCPVSPVAFAWNEVGHMIVAELAWRKLSKSERNAITSLLREHPHYAVLLATNIPGNAPDTNEWIFLRAATWSDMVRPPRPGAPPKPAFITNFHRGDWHFTNAPFVAPADVNTIHPPAVGAGLILEALAANQALVKDKTKPAPDRAVALCWLLHLIGDIHQPLHCTAWFSPEFPEGDLGGNRVAIRPLTAAVNLHSHWDNRLGDSEPTPKYINDRADQIAGVFSSGSGTPPELKHKTYPGWALESFEEAETHAYLNGALNHVLIPPGPNGLNQIVDATVPLINDDYEDNARDRARRRAALAGIRLGRKLKGLF
jgi:hypothetical protein